MKSSLLTMAAWAVAVPERIGLAIDPRESLSGCADQMG